MNASEVIGIPQGQTFMMHSKAFRDPEDQQDNMRKKKGSYHEKIKSRSRPSIKKSKWCSLQSFASTLYGSVLHHQYIIIIISSSLELKGDIDVGDKYRRRNVLVTILRGC